LSSSSELKKQLFFNSKHLHDDTADAEWKQVSSFVEGYKTFLSACKTERECVAHIKAEVQKKGFEEFDYNRKYNPGDKFYYVNRKKAMIIGTIGKQSLESGLNLLVSHIDSPRIDLKPKPLYEKEELAYFKTHYYGGIKKYQWTTIPLALHGKLIKRDGQEVDLMVGEDADDPIFCISDLLPHLASEQMKRPVSRGVLGEELNLVVGSLPFKTADQDEKPDASERVRLNVLKLLNERYGIVEQDFITAELCLVPAGKARDVGFDRSLICAYGQDDRVCAYTALCAHLELKSPTYTTLTVLADKEETGSDGNTGLKSAFLLHFIRDLAEQTGYDYRRALRNSCCLSADVNAAYDPAWPDVFEKNNSSLLNHGVVVTKYTGSGGKFGTADASAEFVYRVTSLFDEKKITWQPGMLGKVDIGGGGTVAKYMANLDMDVVDIGVPVLSMHAPYEITAKLDVFMLKNALLAFASREG
jgi:aspartyl aminopeptidase